MTLTRRPSPFGELVTLRQAMDRLFDDTTFRPTGLEAGRAEATFDHAVLKLRIPRAEQVGPRHIRIQPVTAGEAKTAGTGAQPAKAGA